MQQLTTRGQQLQAEEGVGDSLQQDLQSLENTLSKMEQSMDSQEQSLEVRERERGIVAVWPRRRDVVALRPVDQIEAPSPSVGRENLNST